MRSTDGHKGWQLDMQFSFLGQAEPGVPSSTDDITEAVERVLGDKGFTTTSRRLWHGPGARSDGEAVA